MTTPLQRAVTRSRRSRYRGHPAQNPATCLQCYGPLKGESILCPGCIRAALELHQSMLGAIRASMGSLCNHWSPCAEAAVGSLDGSRPYCEGHVRAARAMDITGLNAFLPFSALPEVTR